MPSGLSLALLATLIGVAAAALGVFSRVGSPRRIVPFSGGLLMGIALFAVIPELAEEHSWPYALMLVGGGVALLWAFGRFVYPVCPSCSHTHDHDHCTTALHGFALPLMAAASLHAFLDGLGVAAAQTDAAKGLGVLVLGVVLHKIPEGIALGIMLRAAVKRNGVAFGLAALAEGATFLGAVLESAVTARFGDEWVIYALALAGGSFVYLGFHAIHGEWQRRGTPAFMPALTGAAGAAALQQGLRLFLR
ncbi:MAG TPA: ZIP family metal transporter [Bryobacteraceae bacterium]|nr:ZIP family metal transporter [Bryobacteraceae bacterium]